MGWGAVAAAAASLYSANKQGRASQQQAQGQLEAAQLAYDAAQYSTDANREIAFANLQAAQEQFDRSLAFAEEELAAQRLGGYDQYGNRTYFDPEKGWVIDLTERSLNQQDAEQRQAMLNATELDRLERERIDRSAALQRTDQQQANGELVNFNNIRRQSPTELGNLLFAQGEMARADSRDDVAQQMITTQARQGNTSNMANLFSELAGQAGKDAQQAKIDTTLKGMYDAGQLYDAERTNSANIYSLFRDRAAQPFNAVTQPTGSVTPLSAPAANPASTYSLFNNAFGQGGIQQPYLPTDFSAANLAAANGVANANSANANSGLINTLGTLAQNPDIQDAIGGLFGGSSYFGDADRTSGNSFGAGDRFAW